MVLDGAEFVIKAGSKARSADGVLSSGSLARRTAARKAGVLIPSDTPGLDMFTADHPTKSTSMAGEMVYGSSCAGPEAWRHIGTGKTYKEWLASQTGANDG
jgi:hypothetical protein